jgi:TonB family protein
MRNHPLLLVTALGLLLPAQDSSAGQVIAARVQNQNGVTAGQAAESAEADQLATEIVKLYKDGKFDEALPLAQRLLELRQRTVGADHFLTGHALVNLAELFLAKRKKEEAKGYFEKAVAVFEKSAESNDLIETLERYSCVTAGEDETKKNKALSDRLFKLYNGFDNDPRHGRALKLATPDYPKPAMLSHTGGAVVVKVTIAETGKVIKVQILCGNPELAKAAGAAAWRSVFQPTTVSGKPVQIVGLIVYRFD